MAENINVNQRVHFLGFRKDVKNICNSADLFVFPSFQEGLSVALMEAMGCGLPIVASNIRGNNDLIVNGKGGVLIDDNNPLLYKDAIQSFMDNKNACKEAGCFNEKQDRKSTRLNSSH